jgi:transposase
MRTIFTKEQIAELRRHPCTFGVSERLISYTYEFKKRALELYAEGISPNEIWKRAGFDVKIWKQGYC